MAKKSLKQESAMLQSWSKEISEGIPILDSINNISEIYPNYKPELDLVMKIVRQGGTIYEAMTEVKDFHPATLYFAAIGENTGDLDKTFLKASELISLQDTKKIEPEKIAEISFYHAFGTLQSGGIPIIRSFEILADLSKELPVYPPPGVLENIVQQLRVEMGEKSIGMDKEKYCLAEIISNVFYDGTEGQTMFNISKSLQDKYSK
jgi:hypothetical protein